MGVLQACVITPGGGGGATSVLQRRLDASAEALALHPEKERPQSGPGWPLPPCSGTVFATGIDAGKVGAVGLGFLVNAPLFTGRAG